MGACIQSYGLVEDLYHNPFMQDPVPYHLLDAKGTILLINRAWMDRFGYGRDHVVGEPLVDYLTDSSLQQWNKYFLIMLTTRQIIRVKLDLRCEDSSVKKVNLTGFVTEHAIGYLCTHCILQPDDEQLIKIPHSFHEALLENTREGVLITDDQKRIIYVNQAFTDLLGYERHEVIGKSPDFLKSGHHDVGFYTSMWSKVAESGVWQGEIWDRQKDGRLLPDLLTIIAIKNSLYQITHYIGIFSDVSRLKLSQQEEIEYLVNHDSLTRLPNRKWLTAYLNQSMTDSHRKKPSMALLILDLDDFKYINDSYGHAVGDDVLSTVAGRLLGLCSHSEVMTRIGGDEFAFILENYTEPDQVARFAERLLTELNQTIEVSNGLQLQLSGTIGIALFPYNSNQSKELLQQADTALYLAKVQQKSRYAFFCQDMTKAILARVNLESALKQAVSNHQFELFFQPKVDAELQRIFSAEALIRWRHPEQGLMKPDQFIPLAEQSGLINEIGDWVMHQACKQGMDWLSMGKPPITIAINVSFVQILQSDWVSRIKTCLRLTGFPAQYLEIEMTESSLIMGEKGKVVADLNELREMGIRIAIDDFGTGYSSLAYLKRYPLDVIKIDKSFIQDLPHASDSAQIVSAIIVMAKSLGLEVIAEGVENFDQVNFLQEKGCHFYQGYLCGKPVPADKFSHDCRHAAGH